MGQPHGACPTRRPRSYELARAALCFVFPNNAIGPPAFPARPPKTRSGRGLHVLHRTVTSSSSLVRVAFPQSSCFRFLDFLATAFHST
jgi:hypothetical protein